MIDVIIPIINEETILNKRHQYYKKLGKNANLIFVDGGSSDNSVEAARQYGKVLKSDRGRSLQKNAGASNAESEHLLFLHVDTEITLPTLEEIEDLLKKEETAGCLTLKVRDPRWIFRFFEELVNFAAWKFQLLDGDLGLFIRKEHFERLGGFENVSIMEDILFGKKLADQIPLTILPEKIQVSSRKWDEKGFWPLFKQYTKTYVDYFLGNIQPLNQEI